jgi:hypothetical protein
VLAGGHEAHRYGVRELVLVALVPVAAGLHLELVGRTCEPVAAVTDEPARKLEGADSDVRVGLAAVALGRHSEVAVAGQIEVRVERFQPGKKRAPEARIVEGNVALLAETPVLEAANHHRPIDQVDHGPGTERGYHLALPQAAFGARRLALLFRCTHGRHRYLSSSCLNRTQTSALGSTSRIDVGAWKYPAS